MFFSIWFTGGCAVLPRKLPWRYPGILKNKIFTVYAQPGLRKEQYKDALGTATEAHTRVRTMFFGTRKLDPINIVLFADYPTYQEHVRRRFSIELIAHYERDIRAVFIARESRDFVWRHELTHAAMESLRPGTEFWLHEGLALFAQQNALATTPTCGNSMRARMPPGLAASLHYLRSLPRLTPFVSPVYAKENRNLIHHPALAGYFVFFLWSRRQLTPLLKRYLADSSKPAHRFLPGFEKFELGKPRKKTDEPPLLKQFRLWLKTKQPARTLAGC